MIISKMAQRSQQGFTMVEVSIASTVFSIVLLVALTTFFAIGHLFYKGISITQTQNVASEILQDVNGDFQTSGSVSSALPGTSGYYYYCIGNTRYTFKINNKVDLDAAENHSVSGNFGLLKDVLPGNDSGCAEPCNDLGGSCPNGSVKLNNPVELLGQRMRLDKFSISQSGSSSLYNISVIVAYGDDDVFDYDNPGDYSTVHCKGDAQTQQYCAVSQMDTALYKGLRI